MDKIVRLEVEQGIRALFEQLEEAVAVFNEWCSSRIVESEAYQLPVFDSPHIPNQIDVRIVPKEESLRLTRRAYGLFDRESEQHPYTVYRLPGCLVVDGNPSRLIGAINRLKNKIYNEVRAVAPVDSTRQLLCRRVFPGVSMLQVYRQIHYAPRALDSLRFTWSPVTVSTRTLDRSMAIEVIDEWMNSENAQIKPGATEAAEIALSQLAYFPASAPILRRKPVAPHPRMTLFYGQGKQAVKSMLHANLPVVIPAEYRKKQFYIKPLNAYDADRKRRTRLDKKSCSVLLEELGLYY